MNSEAENVKVFFFLFSRGFCLQNIAIFHFQERVFFQGHVLIIHLTSVSYHTWY